MQIQKWKIDFYVVALSLGCWNIYWSLNFNQILIWLTDLVTPGPAVVVLAALDSGCPSLAVIDQEEEKVSKLDFLFGLKF